MSWFGLRDVVVSRESLWRVWCVYGATVPKTLQRREKSYRICTTSEVRQVMASAPCTKTTLPYYLFTLPNESLEIHDTGKLKILAGLVVNFSPLFAWVSTALSLHARSLVGVPTLGQRHLVVASRSVCELVHANLGGCLMLIRGLFPTQRRCIHLKRLLCFCYRETAAVGLVLRLRANHIKHEYHFLCISRVLEIFVGDLMLSSAGKILPHQEIIPGRDFLGKYCNK